MEAEQQTKVQAQGAKPKGRSPHLVRTFFLSMVSPAGWLFFRVATYASRPVPDVAKFFERMTEPFLVASILFAVVAAVGMWVSNKRRDAGMAILFAFSVMLNLLLVFMWAFPLFVKPISE